MASPPSTILRKTVVSPASLKPRTYTLAPNDLIIGYAEVSLSWPLFYNYDLDGNKMVDALEKFLEKYPNLCGRVRRDDDLRFVVEVDPSRECGVPFTEQSSDMSIATALMEHSKVIADSGTFPVHPRSIPFYIDGCKTEDVFKGKEALVKLKLTHFSDGCAVSIAIQHLLVDGQRYVEAARDLSRAYRGIEIPDRDLDRSCMWPDQLAKFFPFLGEDVAKLPRKVMPSGDEYNHPQFPDDTGESHILHFSQETLKKMKDMVKPFLKEDEYVSSNDVISAFLWMMQSEFTAEKQPVSVASDLDIDDSFSFSTFEVLRNGIKVIPKNYVGNAFISPFLFANGFEMESDSLKELFARLALVVRKAVLDLRTQPELQAQSLMGYYVVLASGKFPIDLPQEKFRAILTNMTQAPFNEVDYGQGGPIWANVDSVPLHNGLYQVGPGLDNDGVLIFAQLRGSHSPLLKNSVIRQLIAPSMEEIYRDLTIEELKAKLHLTK